LPAGDGFGSNHAPSAVFGAGDPFDFLLPFLFPKQGIDFLLIVAVRSNVDAVHSNVDSVCDQRWTDWFCAGFPEP
jgi:hypothetical protein